MNVNLVVGSAFRDSSGNGQLSRWFKQLEALQREITLSGGSTSLISRLRVVAVEGDSVDDTYQALVDYRDGKHPGIELEIVKCDVGGPRYGSVEHPDRMARLSIVGNAILDAVREDDDYLFYVESDLIWTPQLILDLITRFEWWNDCLASMEICENVTFDPIPVGVMAPMTFAGELHYDIWATRGLDGERFSPFPPYHSSIRIDVLGGPPVVEVSSVGSALLVRNAVARDPRCRMATGALVEWCANVRAAGYRIFVAPDLRVEHPA